MKRKLVLTCLLMLAISLAGCSGGETSPQPAATATTGQVLSTPTGASSLDTSASPTGVVEATGEATAGPSTGATAEATSEATSGATFGATSEATAEPTASAGAAGTGGTGDTTPKVVAATEAFLATLDDTQRKTVLFDWTNTAQKQRWSNLPEGLFTHAGLMWGNMTEAQQQAWLAVMAATLSQEGYDRVLKEWNADDVLAAQQGSGGGGGPSQLFGKKYYFIAIIGSPSTTSPWQWQWGGHHVTVNATIVGSNISLTPSFIGVQPATYTDANGNTIRPLGDIEDEAFALVNVLDTTQKSKAVLGSTAIDLVLGPGQDGKTIQSEGLSASEMTAEQQAMLLTLIGHYTNLVNDEDAATRMADVKSHLAVTYFAWYGPTTKGSAAYFRVTGPTIVIEYSPQGGGGGGPQGGSGTGTSSSANHIHGIYRDPTNDYGAGLINK